MDQKRTNKLPWFKEKKGRKQGATKGRKQSDVRSRKGHQESKGKVRIK